MSYIIGPVISPLNDRAELRVISFRRRKNYSIRRYQRLFLDPHLQSRHLLLWQNDRNLITYSDHGSGVNNRVSNSLRTKAPTLALKATLIWHQLLYYLNIWSGPFKNSRISMFPKFPGHQMIKQLKVWNPFSNPWELVLWHFTTNWRNERLEGWWVIGRSPSHWSIIS